MKYFIFILTIISAISCTNNNTTLNESKEFSLKKTNKNIFESVIDSISIIQLKDEKSHISYIKKVIVKNDRLFISDFNMMKSISVFDLEGNFINTIGERGNSNSEYLMINDFSVDGDNVYVYDIIKKRIMKYDYSGKFINDKKINVLLDAIIKTDNGFLLSSSKENSDKKILNVNNELKIINEYFQYSRKEKDNKLTDNMFQLGANEIYYHKPIDNYIYIFNLNGVVKDTLSFDFGNKSVPKELKYDYDNVSKKRKFNDYIYFYDAPIILNNIIVGRIFNGENKATLIYDKMTKDFDINNIVPNEVDFKKILLPLTHFENKIIGYFDFSLYEIMKNKPFLSQEQLEDLEKGSLFLCIYHLKK